MNNPVNLLQRNGLKITAARVALLEYLEQAAKPVDVSSILEYVNKKKKVSADQATIYRIINKFMEKRIVAQTQFQEGKYRYELTSLPHHHHVVCTNCGDIQDIENCDLEKVEKKISIKYSYTIKSHQSDFFGLCANCH